MWRLTCRGKYDMTRYQRCDVIWTCGLGYDDRDGEYGYLIYSWRGQYSHRHTLERQARGTQCNNAIIQLCTHNSVHRRGIEKCRHPTRPPIPLVPHLRLLPHCSSDSEPVQFSMPKSSGDLGLRWLLCLTDPAGIDKELKDPAPFLCLQFAYLLRLLPLQRAISLECLLQDLLLDHHVRLGLKTDDSA